MGIFILSIVLLIPVLPALFTKVMDNLHGLEEARTRGFFKVVMQLDCEVVVKLINCKTIPTVDVGLVITYVIC